MHRRILAATIASSVVLLAAGRSDAQFLGSSFGTSTYLDRAIGDSVRSEPAAAEGIVEDVGGGTAIATLDSLGDVRTAHGG
jgi:hypothetical protein